jgi:hypothetical protein
VSVTGRCNDAGMDLRSQTVVALPGSIIRHPSSISRQIAGKAREVVGPASWPAGGETLNISCSDCCMQHTDACDDCLVTFICDRQPDSAVVIDATEARAVRLLSQSGLLPELRHRTRAG